MDRGVSSPDAAPSNGATQSLDATGLTVLALLRADIAGLGHRVSELERRMAGGGLLLAGAGIAVEVFRWFMQ